MKPEEDSDGMNDGMAMAGSSPATATEPPPHSHLLANQPTMTTWEDASGEPIFDEYSFMCDRLWIDDADVDEPIEFTRTEWVAVRRTTSWRSEDRPECPSCHGEGETPSGSACGRCLGDGFLADPIERVVSDERWSNIFDGADDRGASRRTGVG